MIGYVTLGTNDLPRAAQFYDAIGAEMGVGRMMDFDTFIAWGKEGGAPGVALTKPYDGNTASVGNGVMVALEAKDKDQVHKLHEIALSHGGTSRALRDRAARASMPAISAIPTETSSTRS